MNSLTLITELSAASLVFSAALALIALAALLLCCVFLCFAAAFYNQPLHCCISLLAALAASLYVCVCGFLCLILCTTFICVF